MSFRLMHCQPDPVALATWATRHGLLSPDGDYGYALHALLAAAFGGQAPKPFRYLGARQGLLAYTDDSPETLQEHASLATPDVARALGLDSLNTRPFPTAWRPGQQLGFEVRVRPVIRTADGRERDAYLHAVESAPAADDASQRSKPGSGPLRETVYAAWLSKQFTAASAVQILQAGMDAFRLSRVVRRAQADNAGKRKPRTISGPDAVFKGALQVTDGDAFARLVARGVGRHRSFGFGMLLLGPARPC